MFYPFLIRKKHQDIDLSSIDFLSIEGHDIPSLDDYVDERLGSRSGPIDTLAFESSPDQAKDTFVVNINSS